MDEYGRLPELTKRKKKKEKKEKNAWLKSPTMNYFKIII